MLAHECWHHARVEPDANGNPVQVQCGPVSQISGFDEPVSHDGEGG